MNASTSDSAIPTAAPNEAVTPPSGGGPAPAMERRDLAEPRYRAAVLELLGMLAHGELQSFGRLTVDALRAPTLEDRIAISRLAVEEFGHMELLSERIAELGAVPTKLMEPFLDEFSEFDRRTEPGDWWERLVKAHVGYGIATDLYREIARLLDPSTRSLVEVTLDNDGHTDYVVSALASATEGDERLSARLSLWGRRLVGEAVTLAQSGLSSHPGMLYLLEAGAEDGESIEPLEILTGLMGEHTRRMERLGLTA